MFELNSAPGSFLSHQAICARLEMEMPPAAPGSFLAEQAFRERMNMPKPAAAPGSLISQNDLVYWIND